MDDYYGILELEPSASAEEIKANYRRLAMKWHPDRNAGSREAEDRFKRISEAYSVLSTAEGRSEYDARRSYAASGAGASGGAYAGAGASGAYGGFAGGFAGGFSGAGTAGQGRGFGARAFTAEEAAWLFMNEMYNLAMELTMQNVRWQDIAAELERRGCPENVAEDIARKIETKRKAMIRANAKPYFVRSALSWGFGALLFLTFAGVGFGLLGFIGLLLSLSGAWNLARALWFLATGRAPAS